MKTLHVQTASSSYPVFIGQGIRKKACELLTSLNRPLTRIMLVTDEEVDRLYGDEMLHFFARKMACEKSDGTEWRAGKIHGHVHKGAE